MIQANFVISAAPSGDHDGAHDQRAENAPEQHLVLVLRRHREVREQQREHEDVVHAQRFLDQVAGEELQRLLRARVMPDAEIEQQRQRDPGDCPGDGFRKETTCALR